MIVFKLSTEQATLAAAIVAAVVSLVTLLLNITTKRSAELRKAHRDVLANHLEELGQALHQTLATSHILLKNRSEESTANWREKAAEAKTKLKALRMKLRYPLWGLDSALKTISVLPDWTDHVRQHPEHSSVLIKRGSALGEALDNTIRKCYLDGRSPNWVEIRRANLRRSALEKAYRDFQDRPKVPRS